MCGIAGLVLAGREACPPPLIEEMVRRLAHRGPDGRGVWRGPGVALGHRRLAVIDIHRRADQPMFDERGEVGLVFNGEIYNYRALRDQLARRGHRFRTQSDTEVLLRAWLEYGEGCLEHLNGMYAFCVYDGRRGRLFLARDPAGKKPLYYGRGPGLFAFASEMDALRAVPRLGQSSEVDRRAVADYATLGYATGDRTIYAAVRKLKPGHCLWVDTGRAVASGGGRFWRPRPRPERGRHRGGWLAAVEEALRQAVRRRMVADVPIGAFLSGGVDSSLVTALMVEEGAGTVKTFSMGFADRRFDESRHARAVAEHLGTDHHHETVSIDPLDSLDRLIRVYQEPFGDASAIPTIQLSRLTRRHVTVALSGDGGDELFFGYPRQRFSLCAQHLATGLGPAGRGLLRRSAGRFGVGKWRRGLQRLALRDVDLYLHLLGVHEERLNLLRPEVRQAVALEHLREIFEADPPAVHVDRCRRLDLGVYLPDDILVKVDRASMHYALEVRCPMLDTEVIELALAIPPGESVGPLRQKHLLKALLYTKVPRPLVDRPKQGFSVPLGRWLRNELRDALGSMLADRASRCWEYLARSWVERLAEDHWRNASADHGEALWRALVFYRWAAVYL